MSSNDGPLAGLVSPEADALYSRLLEAGELQIGTGPGQIDVDSPAARELFDAHIAWRSTLDQDRVLPLGEVQALQLLLAHHHNAMLHRQQCIMRGWERLDSFLPSTLELSAPPSGNRASLVEVVTDRHAISKLSAEIYQSARKELLGISLGTMSQPVDDIQLITPPEPSLDRGVRFRMLYDTAFAADAAGSRIIAASIAAGEEARIHGNIPVKMLHVDDQLALVALTPTGLDGAMVVRSPRLLAALRQWFELLWNDPASTAVDGSAHTRLTATQLAVLRHLASGKSDEAIARALNASVRTVRRHISAILELLDVSSRFAAGAMAGKRGWI